MEAFFVICFGASLESESDNIFLLLLTSEEFETGEFVQDLAEFFEEGEPDLDLFDPTSERLGSGDPVLDLERFTLLVGCVSPIDPGFDGEPDLQLHIC